MCVCVRVRVTSKLHWQIQSFSWAVYHFEELYVYMNYLTAKFLNVLLHKQLKSMTFLFLDNYLILQQ